MAKEDEVFRKRVRKLNGDLRWRKGYATTSVGVYRVEQSRTDEERWTAGRYRLDESLEPVGRGVFSSEYEAMEACEFDYEKRIARRAKERER